MNESESMGESYEISVTETNNYIHFHPSLSVTVSFEGVTELLGVTVRCVAL